jgi:Nuclease-related domain
MDGAAPAKRLRLRYRAVCATCGCDLLKGSEAWWESEQKLAFCLACGAGVEEVRSHAGVAGASARREYDRRREHRERELKGRYGTRLGGIAAKLADDPQSTRAWRTGAAGEERLAHLLARWLPEGPVVLHDRRIPGSRANIDHLIVARSGVWVVDAKQYKGKVEHRRVGPFWRQEDAVFVGGRNRTSLAQAMAKQVKVVQAAVAAASVATVEIRPVLCFVGADWELLASPFKIEGVLVTWPRKLAKLIGADGALSDDEVTTLARRLGNALPPAVVP